MPKEERPIIPPTRKAVSEFRTPSPAVVFYTELVNRTDPAYVNNAPVKRGTQYSSMVGASQDVTTTYPNLYFLGERKFGQSDQLVLWDWASVPNAEDTYNAEVNYVSNGVPYPAFTRVYNILRDVYEFIPTLGIGSNLTALLGVIITERGNGYTYATGTIDGTNVEVDFVCSNGEVISGVVVNEGTGITSTSVITINGDGDGATCIPIVQGTNCYLTSQKKQELPEGDPLKNEFVRVIRTYETLPGPFIETTRIDEDGVVVHVNTRRNIAANIVSAETLITGTWTHTTKKGDDNFVAEENVETRAIPGNPLVTTRVEEDGMITTITKTLGDTTAIVSSEVIFGGNWIRTHKEEVSDLVANQVQESRPIPGNPVVSTKVDFDGLVMTTTKILSDTTTIVSQEQAFGGNWIRTYKDEVSDLVANKVQDVRPIPGNDIIETQINKDGDITQVTRTLVLASTIATTNSIVGTVWTKTYEVPFNGSDLVATKTVEVRNTQYQLPSYSIEIPDLVPQEFRAFIPTTTTETTEIGTASPPTLGTGDLSRSERQLDVYSFRRTITGRASIVLPITHTNKETTEQYGGGVLNVNGTLELVGSGSIDQGLLVVSSSITDLGNGMEFKESKELDDTSWPTIIGVQFDQDMQIEYPVEEQVVDAGYTPATADFTLETVEPVDVWRSKRRKITKIPTAVDPASAITTVKYNPFRFPGLLTTLPGPTYYVRASDSQLCKHTVRTYWVNTVTTPIVAVDEIIMDDPIISTLNNVATLAYAGSCIHDAFTSFGVLFWPATTPTYSDYIATWQGNEKIIAASVDTTEIPNLWKIQAISVIMR